MNLINELIRSKIEILKAQYLSQFSALKFLVKNAPIKKRVILNRGPTHSYPPPPTLTHSHSFPPTLTHFQPTAIYFQSF